MTIETEVDDITELRAAVEGFTTTAEGRFGKFDEALTELKARLAKAETVARRPGGEAPATGKDGELEQRAFNNFLRHGREALPVEEVRSLRVSDDAAGGFLAVDSFISTLDRNIVQYSPVRSVARVLNTSAGAINIPKRTGTMTASWVGETTPRPATTITYGSTQFTVNEAACYVDVSQTMLEDSSLDVSAILSEDFAEEFGRLEATAFVNGAGGITPFGFMNADIAYTPSGSASAVTADGLIDLYHQLLTPYRSNAVWAMNSATIGSIRKLKDPATGAYLLITGGIGNAPTTTLLGRPVLEMPDMPDIAGGATPVVLADFSQYRIFDRVSLSILRDPYSVATSGMVRFHGRRRTGAGVGKAEAFRKLRIATS
ncbi:MAG TPA: phage major capsid protein [Afipia sp.]